MGKYFNGYCQFLKQCANFECTVVDYGIREPLPVAVFLHFADGTTSAGKVQQVSPNEAFSMKGVDAVAATHADNTELTVPTMQGRLFVQKADIAGYGTRVAAPKGACLAVCGAVCQG